LTQPAKGRIRKTIAHDFWCTASGSQDCAGKRQPWECQVSVLVERPGRGRFDIICTVGFSPPPHTHGTAFQSWPKVFPCPRAAAQGKKSMSRHLPPIQAPQMGNGTNPNRLLVNVGGHAAVVNGPSPLGQHGPQPENSSCQRRQMGGTVHGQTPALGRLPQP
jgi:hypothetical protein